FHHRHKRDICSHFPLVVFTVSSLHSKAQVRHLFILPFGHIHSVFFALQSTSATSVHTSLWSYSQCLLCRSAAAKPFDAQDVLVPITSQDMTVFSRPGVDHLPFQTYKEGVVNPNIVTILV